MSLATQLQSLATRIATECKALRTLINNNAGDLSALTTAQKGNLVAALNEVRALAASAGSAPQINDSATNTTAVWSSQKITDQINAAITSLTTGAPTLLNTLDEIAAAIGDDQNFAANMTTALAARVRFDAAQTLTAPQKVQALANIGAAAAADVGDTATDFVATFNAGLV